jgi:hypothetical protein
VVLNNTVTCFPLGSGSKARRKWAFGVFMVDMQPREASPEHARFCLSRGGSLGIP